MYTIKQASEITDIGEGTIRVYINRYQELQALCSKPARDWFLTENAIKWLKNPRKNGRPSKKNQKNISK